MTVKTYTSFAVDLDQWVAGVIIDDEYDVLLKIDEGEIYILSYDDEGKVKRFSYNELLSGMKQAIVELRKASE